MPKQNMVYTYKGIFFSLCCCSVAKSCLTLCDPVDCGMPVFPVLYYLRSLLKLMSIESAMPSNHLIHCCPLLFPPSVFPRIRVFSRELTLRIRWPKYSALKGMKFLLNEIWTSLVVPVQRTQIQSLWNREILRSQDYLKCHGATKACVQTTEAHAPRARAPQ